MSEMLVLVLFGQRKEQYEGQYAPECIAVMSEYDADDNPDYLRAEKAKADATQEFERTEIVSLRVSVDAVMARLRPDLIAVQASVA